MVLSSDPDMTSNASRGIHHYQPPGLSHMLSDNLQVNISHHSSQVRNFSTTYSISQDPTGPKLLGDTTYLGHNLSGLFNDTLTTTTTGSSDLTATQDHHLGLMTFWINAVVTNIIVILGLIGNLLTILILTKRVMRSSTNFYLTALAVWDSVVLVSTALMIGLPGIPDNTEYIQHFYPIVVSYIYPLALVAQTATIWLTVSFTVERYIAVCHPLKAASMCTKSRAKIVIAGVSIGSVLYNIPRWFEYRPVYKFDSTTNTTIMETEPTDFQSNPIFLQVYFSWLYVPIMCIVPLLVLSILNTFLILAVRRSQRQRKDMNVKQSRENNVTIMLVSVVIVFIICQVPALVYNLAWAIDKAYVNKQFGYKVLSDVRNFLVNFNSAINFLLYCAFGQKFRRIFIHTFFRRCVNENYIPMSGVYQHTMTTLPTSQRRYPGYTSRFVQNRNKNNFTNHTSPNLSSRARGCQESSLMTINDTTHKTKQNDREVHTFSVAKDKHGRPNRTCDPTDSDEEPTYDVVLEHLLPESDKDFAVYKVDLGNINSTISV